MKKTTKKKVIKQFNKICRDKRKDLERDIIEAWNLYLNNKQYKPLTSKEIKEVEKLDKKRAQEILKEKRRRAKKITMTVGEFEDKLEEAKGNSYDW